MVQPAAFGAGIRSSFRFARLGAYPAPRSSVQFDVTRVTTLAAPAEEPGNSFAAQGRSMQIYVDGRSLRVVVPGLLDFRLDPDTSRVACEAARAATDSQVEYWFLGQVMPILLLFRGDTELLHATCAEVDGAGVAFLGCSGVGKSTLLDFMLRQGAHLVTDEHLALDRKELTRAYPSIPYYRPYRSVEDLGVRAQRYAAGPVTLRRLYLLRPASAEAPVSAAAVLSAETVSLLLNNRQYNVFNPRLPQFLPLVRQRFAGMAQLARRIPLRILHVPRALHRLAEVYRFVLDDLASADEATQPEHGPISAMARPA